MVGSYMHSVVRIIDRGLNTNSYKFALLRALAQFGREQTTKEAPYKISRQWLAGRFVDYYWPLEIRFRVRQAIVPDKNPVAMRLIRDEAKDLNLAPETSLGRYRTTHGDRYERLVGLVAAKAFGDVIRRFHIVSRRPIAPKLYEIIADGIDVPPESSRFLSENNLALELLAIGAWVKFTEKFTSAPRLYEKIQGVKANRRALSSYGDFLQAAGPSECFYCGTNLDDDAHVDHVIPWAFVAEDRIWNLVLACQTCNGAKSSMTPTDEFLEKLIERNSNLLADADTDWPRVINRDLSEWRNRHLDDEIRSLANRCRADDFGIWAPAI